MKKNIITLLVSLFTLISFAQDYILPNEDLIFSFKTKNGKNMVLAKDKNNEYIIYRFGSSKKIELEYPEKNKESWNKFTYSYYSRGGGKSNAGMELNSIFFQIGNFEYTIFRDYYSEDESFKTGILVTDMLTNRRKEIHGKYHTIKGDLYNLMNDNLIKQDEDRIR